MDSDNHTAETTKDQETTTTTKTSKDQDTTTETSSSIGTFGFTLRNTFTQIVQIVISFTAHIAAIVIVVIRD